MSLDISDFDCTNVGNPVTVTITVIDVNNNSASQTAVVTMEDNVSPTVIAQNIIVQLDENGEAIITPADIDNGSSDACGIDSYVLDVTDFGCEDLGENDVILTVADASGNSTAGPSTITVIDAISPVAICKDTTVYLDETGNLTIDPTFTDNGSSDNCAITLTLDINNFTCENIGENSVTLTVEDASGNISQCEATVNVADTIAPVITCLGGPDGSILVNGSFESGNLTGWTAIDNPEPYLSFGAYPMNDGIGLLPKALPTDGSWLAGNGFDGEAGEAVLYQLITVPSGINAATLTWDENIDYNFVDFASCTECEDRIYEVQIRDASNNILEVIRQVIAVGGTKDDDNIWSTHTANLSAYIGQTIQIAFWQKISEDFTGPAKFALDNVELNVTSGLVADLDEEGKATIFIADLIDSVEEMCGDFTLAIESTQSDSINFDCTHVGANPVKVIATDSYGNSSSCTSIVTVRDNSKPLAICKDITVYLDEAGHAEIDGPMIDNGSYDNCNLRFPLLDKKHFYCSNLGENTVTMTVNDFNGNYDFCTAIVTVADSTSPVMESMADISIMAEAGTCFAIVEFVAPTATDNCAVTVEQTAGPTSGSEFPVGTTVVSFTAADLSGNTASASFIVTVERTNMAPTVSPIADLELPAFTTSAEVEITGIGFGLDCLEQTVTVTATASNTNLVGSANVAYTAGEGRAVLTLSLPGGTSGTSTITVAVKDNGGTANGGIDKSETSFVVTVLENHAPEVTGKVDTIYVDRGATVSESLPTGLFTDADAGDELSYKLTSEAAAALPAWISLNEPTMAVSLSPTATDVGEHKFVLTATDLLGETASINMVVVVQIPTGLPELGKAIAILVYPNPSKGEVYVSVENRGPGEVEIGVYSMIGQEIHRKTYDLSGPIVLDLSGKLDGTYLIKIKLGTNEVTRKIILRK
jgi:hypothetical protein